MPNLDDILTKYKPSVKNEKTPEGADLDSLLKNYSPHAKVEANQDTSKKANQEQMFQDWWENNPNIKAWRDEFIKDKGGPPSLEGDYDYQGAFEAGIVPEKNPTDNKYHWPSIGLDGKELKSEDHPTRWKSDYMEATGEDPDEKGISEEDAKRELESDQSLDNPPKISLDEKANREINMKAIQFQALNSGLLDEVNPLPDYVMEAKRDEIQPFINNNELDFKTYYAQKELDRQVALDKKIEENAEKLELPPDYLKAAVDLNEYFRPVQEEQEQREDYLLGSASQFNEGLSEIVRTVDNGMKMFAESAGFEWQNPLFRDLADALHSVGEGGSYKVPDNIAGNVIGGMARIAPDLAATALIPTMKLKLVSTLTRGAATQVPKFPVLLGAKEGLQAYADSDGEPDRYWNMIKGIAHGAKTGLVYEGYGLVGKQAGVLAKALGANKLVSNATAANASGVLFGADAVMHDPEVFNDGEINWEKFNEVFFTNYGIGMGFHAKQIGDAALNMAAINNSALKRSHAAFWTSNRENIRQGFMTPKSRFDLRLESERLFEAATKAKTPAERNQLLLAKQSIDNMVASKTYAMAVAENPKFFKEELNKSEFFTPQEKEFWSKRIDETVTDYKYAQEIARKEGRVSPEIIEMMGEKKEASKENLTDIANNFNKPEKKSAEIKPQEAENEGAVISEKIKSSQKEEPTTKSTDQQKKSLIGKEPERSKDIAEKEAPAPVSEYGLKEGETKVVDRPELETPIHAVHVNGKDRFLQRVDSNEGWGWYEVTKAKDGGWIMKKTVSNMPEIPKGYTKTEAIEGLRAESSPSESPTKAEVKVETPGKETPPSPKKKTTFLNLLNFFQVKDGKVKLNASWYKQLKDENTRRLIEPKVTKLLAEKQKQLDSEMKQLEEMKKQDEFKKEFVDIKVDGKNLRFKVTKLKDGTYRVMGQVNDGFRKPITDRKLRAKILKANRDKVKQIDQMIADHKTKMEEKLFSEVEAEIKAYEELRNEELPKPAKKFSDAPPVAPTIPSEGKKQTIKNPVASTKHEITLPQLIRSEARAARDAQRFTNKEFAETTDKIIADLKTARKQGDVTAGQHRSIIRRLGHATTPKQREKAYDYVDKVIEGSKYRKQLNEANANQQKVAKANKGEKGKFGTASETAKEYANIDAKQLTLEELYEFNKLSKSILVNKKAPNIANLDVLVSMFKDRPKEVKTVELLNTHSKLVDYVEKIEEGLGEVSTPRDLINLQRKLTLARRKAEQLRDKEIITEEDFTALEKSIGNREQGGGKIEATMKAVKEAYSKVLESRTKEPEIKNGAEEFGKDIRIKLKELLNVKSKDLNSLKFADLEAYSNVLTAVERGELLPYAAELNRKIAASKVQSSTLNPALSKIMNSKAFSKLVKRGFRGPKVRRAAQIRSGIRSLLGMESKQKSEGKNLTELIASIKKHRLDVLFGNYDKTNTIGSVYYAVARGSQRELNEKDRFQDIRMEANKKFRKTHKERGAQTKAGLFLIERSWEAFKEAKGMKESKETASYLKSMFGDEAYKKANDKTQFLKERQQMLDMFAEAKEIGAIKKIEGEEVIDIKKYEEHLRKDKATAELVDWVDNYLKDLRDMAEWSAAENGRSLALFENYFPFLRKEGAKEINPDQIREQMQFGDSKTKMQAGSTYERKGQINWLESDVFTALESYTNDLLRNYHVYPEARVHLSALKRAASEIATNDKGKKQSDQIEFLAEHIASDVIDVMARHYKSGRYAHDYNRGFDKLLKGAKKGMLVTPVRPPAELAANSLRVFAATAHLPIDVIKKSKEESAVYQTMLDNMIGTKYFSKYSPEVGGQAFEGKVKGTFEKGADWFITYADKTISKPLFIYEFDKSFKQQTGKNFNAKEYIKNEDYYIANKEAIEKASNWGVRRVEELFNDKSIMTTPQLTRFLGGTWRPDATKLRAKVLDVVMSFNRNEVDQIIDAGRRIRYGDREMKATGMRDMLAITSSNMVYQGLRRGLGVGFSVMLSSILGQQLTEFEREKKNELLTAESLMADFRRSNYSLIMGGSSNLYSWSGRFLMYVLENSGVVPEYKIEAVYKQLEEDLYMRRMDKFGGQRGIIASVSPAPSVVSNDLFDGLDGIASVVSAIEALTEGNYIPKEDRYKIYSLFNLGAKYAMPNPVSPTLQGVIKRKQARIRAAKKRLEESGEEDQFEKSMRMLQDFGE